MSDRGNQALIGQLREAVNEGRALSNNFARQLLREHEALVRRLDDLLGLLRDDAIDRIEVPK